MSTENLDNITKAIHEHRKAEDRKRLSNPAVARFATLYDNKAMNIWMTKKPNNAGFVNTQDSWTGNKNLHYGPPTTLIPTNGKHCSRDSKMGGHLIMAKEWKTTYTQPNNKEIALEVLSRCQYIPDGGYRGEASNVEITLPDHERVYLINSLQQYLQEAQNESDTAKIQRELLERRLAEEQQKAAEEKRTQEITNEMAAHDLEVAARKDKKARNQRLRKLQTSLRMKPILDAQQEQIKRSGFYDNSTVIIDGGPGTGKTTSLIQRIKYFTDSEVIEENLPNLKAEVRRDILDRENPSWLFLSPSTLLEAYLKESMSQEGLLPNKKTVQVWNNLRSALIKEYGLIRPDRANAFLAYRRHNEKAFFLQEGKGIKAYTDKFERFLLLATRKLLKPAQDFNREGFLYAAEVKQIQDIITESNPRSIIGLVTLLEALKSGPGALLSQDAKELNENLRKITLRIQSLSTQDEDRKTRLHDLIRESIVTLEIDTTEEPEDDELDEDNERDAPEDEQDLYSEAAITKRLNGKIRGIVRKLASQSIGQRAKLTASQEKFMLLLVGTDEIAEKQLRYIGEALLFRKVFGRILRGTGSVLLNRLPTHYRSFRKALHEQPIVGVVSISTLEVIVGKDGNKRLHPDEQSFLIGYINNFLKSLYEKKKRVYNNLKHGYKEAYEESAKRVIAVDEASDFTLTDIYAIESLLKPEYASLTLCGDIMQRITKTGIRQWEDVNIILDKVEENSLEISYRQSPTLLRIAKDIYERTTDTVSQYRPAMKSVDDEPKGLLLTSEVEEDKVEWIADRVMEICRSMDGTVPSIAIFLPTGSNINTFTGLLGDTDVLADHDIRVMACQDGQALGDERTVRVFDIKHIKGLEFEAAFFHNVDGTLDSGYTPDMLLRNLYVGLSRATFYSAITTKRALPEELAFLADHFVNEGHW